MKALKTAALLILACMVTHAGDFSVPIRDMSPPGSPVTNTGTITISVMPSGADASVVSHRDEWKAKNISDKSIVALVATLSIGFSDGPEMQVFHQYEAFFHPTLANPGDEIDLFADTHHATVMKMRTGFDQPKCDVVVRWVQFQDGTTFGDRTYAAGLLQARKETWSALAHLNDVYRTKGASGFLETLQGPVSASANADGYVEHLRIFQREHGTEATVVRLQEHLRMAEQRATLVQ